MSDKDKDSLRDLKKNVEEAVDFFSSKNKKARELFVVKSFLLGAGEVFKESELECLIDDPPDVLYRGARFEVKELLDEGRKRHAEYKETLLKIDQAESLKDFMEPYSPKELTIDELMCRINKELSKIKYSPDVNASLDLLFYFNLQDYEIDFEDQINVNQSSLSKWRSVSIVDNGNSIHVFWADEKAPDFIKALK